MKNILATTSHKILLLSIFLLCISSLILAISMSNKQREMIRCFQSDITNHLAETCILLRIGADTRDRGQIFMAGLELRELHGILSSSNSKKLGIDDHNTFPGSIENLSNTLLEQSTNSSLALSDDDVVTYEKLATMLEKFCLTFCDETAVITNAPAHLRADCSIALINDTIQHFQVNCEDLV